MKNTQKLWFIAFIAVIGFLASACGDGSGGESFDSGISLVLADRLEFSGLCMCMMMAVDFLLTEAPTVPLPLPTAEAEE